MKRAQRASLPVLYLARWPRRVRRREQNAIARGTPSFTHSPRPREQSAAGSVGRALLRPQPADIDERENGPRCGAGCAARAAAPTSARCCSSATRRSRAGPIAAAGRSPSGSSRVRRRRLDARLRRRRARGLRRLGRARASPCSFAFVDDSADADVHVTSSITSTSRSAAAPKLGARRRLVDHRRRHRARRAPPHRASTLDDDAMHAMALHEIGHLLGLDHTAGRDEHHGARFACASCPPPTAPPFGCSTRSRRDRCADTRALEPSVQSRSDSFLHGTHRVLVPRRRRRVHRLRRATRA